MMKQGVSFYSYQNAYRTGKLDMEGMVAEVAKLGCDGVELVPIMTPPTSYPKATDAEIAAWHELMAKYGTRPTCFDSIIVVSPEWAARSTGPTHIGAGYEEQVQLMRDELTLCHQLGFPILRIPQLYGVQMGVFEELLPMAEDLGIQLGLEIHVPMTIRGPKVQNYMEFIDRKNTKFAGLIPDMAIFASTLPVRLVNKVLAQGADEGQVRSIVKAYEVREDMARFGTALREEGLKGTEELLSFAERFVPSEVEEQPAIIPYIIHFHGKFYDVDETIQEHGIRFDRVVPMLKDAGWEGYINSEYEGQRMYLPGEEADEIEQVRRQHLLVDKRLK